MSCAVLIAASLLMADPVASAQAPAPVPASIAAEPLYADIVLRAQGLKRIVDGWIAGGAANDADFARRPDFAEFSAGINALAERDMAGHLDLRERNTDGDLKCILRGLAEDIPVKLAALAEAEAPPARAEALSDLAYLLDDNAAVILAPPAPTSATVPAS